MKPEPRRFLSPSSRNDRRRQKQSRRRRLALIVTVIVLAAGVLAWAIILPGFKKAASSTSTTLKTAVSVSTSLNQPAASSTTSTSVGISTTTSVATDQAGEGVTYSALLSGENEIPAVVTSANGTLTLTVTGDGSSVHYLLRVNKVASLTLARLHEGKAGATGTTILTIYGGPTRTDVFSGIVTQGSFTAEKLLGPLKGKSISHLEALIKAGSVYLNVGTSDHPQGEIRGQLE
jgi:hypothetical protein